MLCDRCGKALPSVGVVCPHCGAMMNKSQLEMQKKMRDEYKKHNRPEYLSDKFGVEKNIEFNETANHNINIKQTVILFGIISILIIIMIIVFSVF